MSGANVNGTGLISIELTKPRVGAWHADVVLDVEEAPSGAATITVDDVIFVGTVLPGRSGVFGRAASAKIVGGKGGLSKVLNAKQYSGGSVTLGSVVRDILRAAGEELSATADAATLGHGLTSWESAGGQASHVLTQVCDAIGATWRVLNDGTVWVGVETWPAVAFDHVVEDEDWAQGVIQIESDAPLLEPGTVLEGQRLDLVRHFVHDAVLRSYGHLNSPTASLARFRGGFRRLIDYSRQYPSTVSAQRADGTLQLVPDDARMKGSGVDKVRARHGLPGFKVKVLPGARVMLGFDNGDPTKPFAALWDEDGASAIDSIEFTKDGLGAGFARIGDSVTVFAPTLIPVTGTVSGNPFTGVITITDPFVGAIDTGNPSFLG